MNNNSQILVRHHMLNPAIIERINGRRDIKPELAKALGLTRSSIWRLLVENKPNGPLTTVSAVEIISRILDIDPSEVLSEVNTTEPCTA